MCLDCHAKAVRQPLGCDPQVHFPLPMELQFGHLGVLHEGEGVVFVT